jgi:hypothetical protein
MRSGLASRVPPTRLSGRPQDPDVRFSAPMAAAAETRSAPTGIHSGRRVRGGRHGRRVCGGLAVAARGYPFSRGAAGQSV